MSYTPYTLELDCPPGNPRPGDLLDFVMEGTDIPLNPWKPDSALFGCWMWRIPPDFEKRYEVFRDAIAIRIQTLYEKGQIRYGSW
jgi:hypothetical protein